MLILGTGYRSFGGRLMKKHATLFDISSIIPKIVSINSSNASGLGVDVAVKKSARKTVPAHDPLHRSHEREMFGDNGNISRNESKDNRSQAKMSVSNLKFQYQRLEEQDKTLSSLLTIVRSRKRRDNDRKIIVEGHQLINEAVLCHLKINTLIFSQKAQLSQLEDTLLLARTQQTEKIKIYNVPQHVLKVWSTLTRPPGVMAIFERPLSSGADVHSKLLENCELLPITVVCDNIREPNNLGSIIRTCAALSCFQVVIIRGSCDPWDSKALRGGCGGQFRVPIRDDVDWKDLVSLIPGENVDKCCVFLAESNLEQVKYQHKIELVDYLQINRTENHNIVIIGGESQGVSNTAYNFFNEVGQGNKILHVPLANGMQSLNVGSALTLILYEIRKQLLHHRSNE